MAGIVHRMVLVNVHASGAEEWRCSQCGRHFVMQWQPDYQRVVLCQGDETAIHNTGKGAMVVYRPQAEDPWLTPWQQWFERRDDEHPWND